MFVKKDEKDEKFEASVKKAAMQLSSITKSVNLINVFRLDEGDIGQDIELAILRAFLNSKAIRIF